MTSTASLSDSPGVSRAVLAGGGGGSLRRILVPADAFGHAARGLALAARVSCAVGGELRVVHIRAFDPPARGCGRFYVESATDATAVIDRALTGAWGHGCRASGIVVDAERSLIARAILAAASEWRADVIILTRRPRRALGVVLLGSITHQVMREARCPVLVVRQEKPATPPEVASHVRP
jgi:nucleotide-binding universal stress UspA family protein